MRREHLQKIDITKVTRSLFSDQAKEIIDSLSQNNILDIDGVLILPMSLWDDVHEQICCETEDCQQILLDEFYKQPNKVLDDVIEKDIAPIFMGDYSYVLLTDDGTCVPVTNDELVEHPELKSCAFVNQSKIPSKEYAIIPASITDEVFLK